MSVEDIPEEKLQIQKLIGAGGFGEVYLAWHKDWGHYVALKKLNIKHNQHGQEQLRVEAEKMRSAISIDHVLRVYGLCCCADASYGLVMEYMEKGSLDWLHQMVRSLPWALRFRILHEVSLGMNRLHDLSPSLLHLDLKPQNVLLNNDLHIKISDFGLSRFKRGTTLPQDARPADGTLEYMAPELLDDINCSPTKASDVYSYAILTWCVLKGEEPYSNAKSSVIRLQVPWGQRPCLKFLQDLYNHVEKLQDMKNLMVKCWDQEPSQRPSFKDCIQTTGEIFRAYKQQEIEAVYRVSEALKKMETLSEEAKWADLCSSSTSGVLEKFETMRLEQPPSYMNEAVPLSEPTAPPADPTSRKPQECNSTFMPALAASTQGAQERIPQVTPHLPINETGRTQAPVSSAHPHVQELAASTLPQTPPPRPGPQTRIIGNLKYAQIGSNNYMEIRQNPQIRTTGNVKYAQFGNKNYMDVHQSKKKSKK